MLSGEYNLKRAAAKILDMGPHTLVIKRGEYGAILFHRQWHFIVPGYLLEEVFDPTGAGDCFAGGFIGYLAEKGFDLKNGHIDAQGTQPRRHLWLGDGQLLLREIRRGAFPHADARRDRRALPGVPGLHRVLKNARLEIALVHWRGLIVLSAAATALVHHFGWTLYYGDAEAHLNIARRIMDSRTPRLRPARHRLAAPAAPAYAAAGVERSAVAQRLGGRDPLVGLLCDRGRVSLLPRCGAPRNPRRRRWLQLGIFALNPNLLYLQATPMTEPASLAGLMALLYFSVRFHQTQSLGAVAGAGLASLAASLARYEGWFVIPFAAFYFLMAARRHKIAAVLVFTGIAALGPFYWLAHNWLVYSNALEFFNGPYSAQSIYRQTLAQNMTPYPGDHDWRKTWLFFRTAARLCAGWGAVPVAAGGLIAAVWKRVFWPILFAALLPVFYLWSMHSGGTPDLCSPVVVRELLQHALRPGRAALARHRWRQPDSSGSQQPAAVSCGRDGHDRNLALVDSPAPGRLDLLERIASQFRSAPRLD